MNVVLNDTDQHVRSRRIFAGCFVFRDSHELSDLRAVTNVFISRRLVSYTITRDRVPELRRHTITPAEEEWNIRNLKVCDQIFSARNSSCRKVMFSLVSVCLSTGGEVISLVLGLFGGGMCIPGPKIHTVGKRAVCILLECFLVQFSNYQKKKGLR